MFPEVECLNVMQVLAQLREQFFSSEKNRLALNVCSRYFYPPALNCSFSTETCFKVGPFGGMSPEKQKALVYPESSHKGNVVTFCQKEILMVLNVFVNSTGVQENLFFYMRGSKKSSTVNRKVSN